MNRFLRNLEPSATLELNQMAKNLAQQGKSIVNLTAGEPDFNTPDRIIFAANDAAKEGKTKYTQVSGIVELRAIIIQNLKTDYHREYNLNEVVVTNGGKQAIFNICFTLLNPDDEVIIPSPSWVSYKEMVEMIGARAVILPSGIEKKFEPDLAAIEAKINSKTKLLILNSPNNPSGAVFSKKFFAKLEEMLLRHPDLFVLTDDIYDKFVYDSESFYSIGMSQKIAKDRLFIVGGVSKTYSMTGWRVGYAAGPAKIMSVISNVQSQTTSNVCSVAQWAALEAYQGSTRAEFEHFLSLFEKRKNLAFESISNIQNVECVKPQGAFYIFPKIDFFLNRKTNSGKLLKTDTDLSYYLLDEKGLATVPGSAFGLSGYIRFSFVVSFEYWNEGIRRFAEGLKELR